VLRSDVEGLGRKGDICDVAAGYARNYLVPRGLALKFSPAAEKQAAAMRRAAAMAHAAGRADGNPLRFESDAGEVFDESAGEGRFSRPAVDGGIHRVDVDVSNQQPLGFPPADRTGEHDDQARACLH